MQRDRVEECTWGPLCGGWQRGHSHTRAHTHALTPQEASWPVPGLELEGPFLPPPGAAPSALWYWVNYSISVRFCPVSLELSGGHVWGAWHGCPTRNRCTPSPPPARPACDYHL